MASFTMAAARTNKNLSQQQIADKLGISRATYSEIETGKKEIKPIYLYAFCHVVGLSEDDIILPKKST